MEEQNLKVERGCKEEVTVRMLFGEEIEGFGEDGFEGSKEEYQIFMEVFYGSSADDANNNHNDVSRRTNFLLHECSDSKPLANLNCNSSVMTSYSSQKGSSSEQIEHAKMSLGELSGFECFPESSSSWAGSDVHDVNVKRMGLSSVELVTDVNRVTVNSNLADTDFSLVDMYPSKVPSSASIQNTLHAHQEAPCHIVETCGRGILSSYYLLGGQEEVDGTGDIDDSIAFNDNCRSQEKDCKRVIVAKSVTSPISQESFAPGLLVASAPAASVEMPGALIQMNHGAPESSILNSETIDAASKKFLIRDLPDHLRAHANQLLVDAGWKIEPRKRSDRTKLASYFISPVGGSSITSLSQAWKACGKRLSADALDSEQTDYGREWENVDKFWGDLTDVLMFIENKTLPSEDSLPLLQRWQLLDPFMAVVCINKKIGALREGKALRAVNSAAFILNERKDAILVHSSVEKVHYHLTPSNLRPPSTMSITPAVDLDHRDEMIEGSGNQQDLQHCQMTGSIGGLTSKLEQASAGKLVNASAKKACKRSKKISEIEATEVSALSDENCREVFSSPMEGKIDDHIELTHGQEESSLEKHHTLSASKIEKMHSSAVPEILLTKKAQKKDVKLETKAARQCGKNKKGSMAMHLGDVPGSNMLNVDGDQNDMTRLKSTKNKFNAKRSGSKKSISVGKSPQKFSSLSKKLKRQRLDSEDSVVMSDDGDISTESHDNNKNAKFGVFPDPQNKQKVSMPKKLGFRINDDDLLASVLVKNKDLSSCDDKIASKVRASESTALRKLKSQKRGCRLLLRTPGKGAKHSMDGNRLNMGARTVLRWLLELGVVSSKDILQYRNLENQDVVKCGRITRDGILCKCCSSIFSVNDFKVHAGSKLQKPSPNLYLESGVSYTSCMLQAWSAACKVRKNQMQDMEIDEVDQNDDTCGFCGDGGNLICCDNCPSTYHRECLPAEDIPEGSWYCHRCLCKSCGDVVKGKEGSGSLAVLQCSHCENIYHDSCLKEKIVCNDKAGSGSWFCGRTCQEVYLGLRSHVGVLNSLGEGFLWTILRCNHEVKSTQKMPLLAECNMKLSIALSIMEECFLPMVDPRTGIDMLPHVVYNRGCTFARLNYQGFYTVVLEKGDEILSVASIRVHGDTVAEMPLVATSSERRRQGMCRRLMDAIEKMLKSLKVKMLVLLAIPNLVDTWTSGFGFKPIEEHEKRLLDHLNLMLLPGTLLLTKILDEGPAEASDNAEREKKDLEQS